MPSANLVEFVEGRPQVETSELHVMASSHAGSSLWMPRFLGKVEKGRKKELCPVSANQGADGNCFSSFVRKKALPSFSLKTQCCPAGFPQRYPLAASTRCTRTTGETKDEGSAPSTRWIAKRSVPREALDDVNLSQRKRLKQLKTSF